MCDDSAARVLRALHATTKDIIKRAISAATIVHIVISRCCGVVVW